DKPAPAGGKDDGGGPRPERSPKLDVEGEDPLVLATVGGHVGQLHEPDEEEGTGLVVRRPGGLLGETVCFCGEAAEAPDRNRRAGCTGEAAKGAADAPRPLPGSEPSLDLSQGCPGGLDPERESDVGERGRGLVERRQVVGTRCPAGGKCGLDRGKRRLSFGEGHACCSELAFELLRRLRDIAAFGRRSDG